MAVSTLLSNATSNTTGSVLDCRNAKQAAFVIAGIFDAAVNFQFSLDGTNFYPYIGRVNGSLDSSVVYNAGYVVFNVEPVAYIRPVVSAYQSGSITVLGYVDDSKINSVQIANATVLLPVDKQSIYRTQAFITTTALNASASFTSATFDGSLYRRLTGKVYADQAGTLNIQHSDDGVTWDTLTSISVTANTPAKFDEVIYARYIRVYYVNGATAQTTFRLSGYASVE